MSHFTHDIEIKFEGRPQPKVTFEAEFNTDGKASTSEHNMKNVPEGSLTLQQHSLLNHLIKVCQDLYIAYEDIGIVNKIEITKKP